MTPLFKIKPTPPLPPKNLTPSLSKLPGIHNLSGIYTLLTVEEEMEN